METYTYAKTGKYNGDLATLLSRYPSRFIRSILSRKPNINFYITAKIVDNIPVTILVGQNLLGFDPNICYNILIGVQSSDKEKNKIVMSDLESKLGLKLEDIPADLPISYSDLVLQ